MSKRDAILARLAAFILSDGLEVATLRALAQAADQSDRMLLYYFKDKDEIIAAALELLRTQMNAALAEQRVSGKLSKTALHAHLDEVVLSDELWPFFRLWLDIAARAARTDAAFVSVAQQLGSDFHTWIEDQLVTGDAMVRRQEATEIMIGLEGVMVLKAIGMTDLVNELV